MNLDRRSFLRQTALGAAGLSVSTRLAAAEIGALPAYAADRPEA